MLNERGGNIGANWSFCTTAHNQIGGPSVIRNTGFFELSASISSSYYGKCITHWRLPHSRGSFADGLGGPVRMAYWRHSRQRKRLAKKPPHTLPPVFAVAKPRIVAFLVDIPATGLDRPCHPHYRRGRDLCGLFHVRRCGRHRLDGEGEIVIVVQCATEHNEFGRSKRAARKAYC